MTSEQFVPPAQWYATLPTVHVSTGVLLTDHDDRVLLVKPNYRPYWALPGGIAEEGEPPHHCAQRETAEELGLQITPGLLLVVDWAPPLGERFRPMMNFLFDGGTTDPADLTMQTSEPDEIAFYTWDDAAARIPAARQARNDQRTIYLPQR